MLTAGQGLGRQALANLRVTFPIIREQILLDPLQVIWLHDFGQP